VPVAEISHPSFRRGASAPLFYASLENVNIKFEKNILTIIKICINVIIIFFVRVIKTMSNIARNQNLAISILPLLLGLALLRLLLKAFSPSFLGRH
jgi:hypothetical protein